MSFRTGIGFDVHRLVEERRLILGGVEIPFEKGLYGHSDADVLTHSVCDALLGAAGLCDIGHHFPDTEAKYKNISSLILLEETVEMIKKESYTPLNVDITLIAEKPKIANYISDMKVNLKNKLGNDCQVNIKATTTEGLGITGRSKAIASMAVCLLNKKDT